MLVAVQTDLLTKDLGKYHDIIATKNYLGVAKLRTSSCGVSSWHSLEGLMRKLSSGVKKKLATCLVPRGTRSVLSTQ